MGSGVLRPHFLRDRGLQLMLFGGKGGVGKTTCALATALRLARCFPEETCLLVSTDPAHSLSDSLAGFLPPFNLKILELDARKTLEAFLSKHNGKFREIASRGTFLDDQDIDQFLRLSLPGLDELVAFLEIAKWVQERTYKCIVVDTAPTGHTRRLLEMPELLKKWLGALDAMLAKHRYMAKMYRGHYQRDALDSFLLELATSIQQMRELLEDPERGCFVPVMMAEPLVITETSALVSELERLRIPIAGIVVNQLYPAGRCPVCESERMRQWDELARFPEVLSRYPLWGVPLYPQEVCGAKALEMFWGGVFRLNESATEYVAPAPSRNDRAGRDTTRVRVEGPAGLPAAQVNLLLFAGKGGVGKTTLVCATAVRLARDLEDKEVMLFSTDPAHSLSACLEIPLGPEPVRVCRGLRAVEMDAQAEFESLKALYAQEMEDFLESLLPGLDLPFDRQVMAKILDLSPPGLDEVMALSRAMQFLGQDGCDILVLDCAPTGHLIRLLEMPELIEQWLKTLFGFFLKYKHIFRIPTISQRLVEMSKNLKRFRVLLCDPERTALYAVSQLTDMAFEETRDLVAACDRLGVHVPALLLNLATPPGDCALCSALHQRESNVRRKFRKTFPNKRQTLIYRCPEPRGFDNLTDLGQSLYQGAQQRETMESRHARSLA